MLAVAVEGKKSSVGNYLLWLACAAPLLMCDFNDNPALHELFDVKYLFPGPSGHERTAIALFYIHWTQLVSDR